MKEEAVQGKDIAFNRKILENKNTEMLILSHTDKKDRLKQRDSGLNQVLCKIAKDNNIALAIDLNELMGNKDKKERGKILARILQNIKLIKKFKNKFLLLNSGNKNQAFSLLLSWGLPTSQTKEALK